MNDNATLAQQLVAAAPAATRNVNLSTDPRRMGIHQSMGRYVSWCPQVLEA
jgi:hypothetical protein